MNILRKLFLLMRPYWKPVLLGIILSFLTISSNMGLLITSAYLISWAALSPSVMELMTLVAGVRFFGLSRGVFRYGERYVTHRGALSILGEIRIRLYQALENLTPGQLTNLHSGQMLTRLVNDVETLREVYLRVFLPPLVAILVFALTSFFLSFFHWSLVLVFLAFYFLATIGITYIADRLYRVKLKLADTKEFLGIILVDGIKGLTEILSLGSAKEYQEKALGQDSEFALLHQSFAKKNALLNALMQLFANLALFFTLVLGIFLVSDGRLDGIWLAALILGVQASFEASQGMSQLIPHLKEGLSAGKRIFEIEKLSQKRLVTTENKYPLPASFEIKVEGLSFTYPGSDLPALKNICLQLAEGKRLAIVGPVGSGKSTIVQLLLKFWDYGEEGTITLGGRDLKYLPENYLWNTIGIISRQTYLFNATLRENLLLAKPGTDDQEILNALEQVRFLPHLALLPEGLDTKLGEGAWKLSGGQRQLVSLARVVLKNPAVLILDEATEGLDPTTEAQVLLTLQRLMEGRSIIMITHRLANLEKMDEIIFIKEGSIVERGTHQDLLEKKGYYNHYYRLSKKY